MLTLCILALNELFSDCVIIYSWQLLKARVLSYLVENVFFPKEIDEPWKWIKTFLCLYFTLVGTDLELINSA